MWLLKGREGRVTDRWEIIPAWCWKWGKSNISSHLPSNASATVIPWPTPRWTQFCKFRCCQLQDIYRPGGKPCWEIVWSGVPSPDSDSPIGGAEEHQALRQGELKVRRLPRKVFLKVTVSFILVYYIPAAATFSNFSDLEQFFRFGTMITFTFIQCSM